MSANEWSVSIEGVDRLLVNVAKIPDRSERIINDRLKIFAAPLAMQNIQGKIPVSKWNERVLNKTHARYSKALTVKHDNLAFTIRPRPKFSYIKYPDLAIGTSRGNEPKRFIRRGLETSVPQISDDLDRAVKNEINKTLKG